MEMSLIGSCTAKFSAVRSDVCQLGNNHINNNNNNNNNYNNNNLMMICSSATKSQMSSGQNFKCCNLLPLIRVTAQSVDRSESAAVYTKDSQNTTISNHKDGVKLYVGLPTNSVSDCNGVNNARAISAGLGALKLLGVEGVELPIWWGVVEKQSMGNYEWSGFLTLIRMIQKLGHKLHVSLNFHASKDHNIRLPKWVSEIGESKPDIFFADRSGNRYKECLSFGVDDVPVFDGKTAIQVYEGFIESFKTTFSPFMGSTITGVTIGMGPDGELRYPSHHYENSNGYGAGEFQCYDENMMIHLKQHAQNLGNPLWGLSGPHDAPSFDQQPMVNTFFKEGGSWSTPYGDFFLSWYSTQLISHADRMLSLVASSFSNTQVMVSGKLPLIHSWYKTHSHPAEVAAGFYNTINRNGYQETANIFSKNSCRMILPGMDLLDEQQPNGSFSSPELLLEDIKVACRNHNVEICGQNVNVAGSIKSFEQIKKNLVGANGIDLFIYQRMGAEFFSPENFRMFSGFVRRLNDVEFDSDDDLGVNEGEGAVFVPCKNRKMQAA